MPSPCMSSPSQTGPHGADQPCSKEVDGIVYEVDCSMVQFKEGDVDIGTLPVLRTDITD